MRQEYAELDFKERLERRWALIVGSCVSLFEIITGCIIASELTYIFLSISLIGMGVFNILLAVFMRHYVIFLMFHVSYNVVTLILCIIHWIKYEIVLVEILTIFKSVYFIILAFLA
jgi:hypothetical protein